MLNELLTKQRNSAEYLEWAGRSKSFREAPGLKGDVVMVISEDAHFIQTAGMQIDLKQARRLGRSRAG